MHAATHCNTKVKSSFGVLYYSYFCCLYWPIEELKIRSDKTNILQQDINYDLLSIGGIIFIIFTIIISAFFGDKFKKHMSKAGYLMSHETAFLFITFCGLVGFFCVATY